MYAVRVFPFRRSIPGGYHSYNPMKIYFKPNAKPDPMLIRFKMCWMDTFPEIGKRSSPQPQFVAKVKGLPP